MSRDLFSEFSRSTSTFRAPESARSHEGCTSYHFSKWALAFNGKQQQQIDTPETQDEAIPRETLCVQWAKTNCFSDTQFEGNYVANSQASYAVEERIAF